MSYAYMLVCICSHEKVKTEDVNMITAYHVDMICVQDADAFIVYYVTDYTKRHLVLIDAGRYGNGDDIVKYLNTHYRGLPIELAIVTHPDDDHFGGFIAMLEKIKSRSNDAVQIQKFWVNDPREHFTTRDVEEDMPAEELDKRLGSIYMTEGKILLDMIDDLKIPRQEIFAKTILTRIENDEYGRAVFKRSVAPSMQEGFYVLGPEISYYESESTNYRYKKNLTFVEATSEDEDIDDDETDGRLKEHLSYVLDEADRDPSSHNKSSLIILFQPEDGVKYLFTGDASTDSFDAMLPACQLKCLNISWLKVPHHGSKANLNTKWIKHFNPKDAFISTLRRGKYLNQCTINALKKNGCDVVSTHNNPTFESIVFHDSLGRNLKPVVHS